MGRRCDAQTRTRNTHCVVIVFVVFYVQNVQTEVRKGGKVLIQINQIYRVNRCTRRCCFLTVLTCTNRIATLASKANAQQPGSPEIQKLGDKGTFTVTHQRSSGESNISKSESFELLQKPWVQGHSAERFWRLLMFLFTQMYKCLSQVWLFFSSVAALS